MFDARALPEDEEHEYARRTEIGALKGHKPTLKSDGPHDWSECECGWESSRCVDSADGAWAYWERHAIGEGISFDEAD